MIVIINFFLNFDYLFKFNVLERLKKTRFDCLQQHPTLLFSSISIKSSFIFPNYFRKTTNTFQFLNFFIIFSKYISKENKNCTDLKSRNVHIWNICTWSQLQTPFLLFIFSFHCFVPNLFWNRSVNLLSVLSEKCVKYIPVFISCPTMP